MLIGIHREYRERSRSSSLSALPNGWALITLHRSVPGTSLVFLVTCIDIPLCHYFKPCSVISSCSASASSTTDISSHHSVIQCLSSHYMTKEHCHLLIVAYNSLLSFAFPKQSLLVIKSCNNCWVIHYTYLKNHATVAFKFFLICSFTLWASLSFSKTGSI